MSKVLAMIIAMSFLIGACAASANNQLVTERMITGSVDYVSSGSDFHISIDEIPVCFYTGFHFFQVCPTDVEVNQTQVDWLKERIRVGDTIQLTLKKDDPAPGKYTFVKMTKVKIVTISEQ
jgi:hypothetical protein